MSDLKVSSELKGNTLRVYWYLLESSKSSVGPRDVQRKLGFSSPNLAVYHLEKLVEIGLADKTSGEYFLTKTVDVGIFKQFIKFGSFVFPRQVLYASMWTTLFVFYMFWFRDINFYSVFGFIFGGLGTAILWLETLLNWRKRPR